MNAYLSSLNQEMIKLSRLSNSIYIGQQVGVTDFYGILKGISPAKRLELPVAEELQMGMSLGLSLEGYLPISIYQRMDFLPRACDQLVNHLDITTELSRGIFKPKVIIFTTVGTNNPVDVGLQHNKNLLKGFEFLLRNIIAYELRTPQQVRRCFTMAKKDVNSSILIAYQELL